MHRVPQINDNAVIELACITGLSLLEKAGKVSIKIPLDEEASNIWTDFTFSGNGCNGSLSPEFNQIK